MRKKVRYPRPVEQETIRDEKSQAVNDCSGFQCLVCGAVFVVEERKADRVVMRCPVCGRVYVWWWR